MLTAIRKPHKSSFEPSDFQSRIGSTLGGGRKRMHSCVFHLFKKENAGIISQSLHLFPLLLKKTNYFNDQQKTFFCVTALSAV